MTLQFAQFQERWAVWGVAEISACAPGPDLVAVEVRTSMACASALSAMHSFKTAQASAAAAGQDCGANQGEESWGQTWERDIWRSRGSYMQKACQWSEWLTCHSLVFEKGVSFCHPGLLCQSMSASIRPSCRGEAWGQDPSWSDSILFSQGVHWKFCAQSTRLAPSPLAYWSEPWYWYLRSNLEIDWSGFVWNKSCCVKLKG